MLVWQRCLWLCSCLQDVFLILIKALFFYTVDHYCYVRIESVNNLLKIAIGGGVTTPFGILLGDAPTQQSIDPTISRVDV